MKVKKVASETVSALEHGKHLAGGLTADYAEPAGGTLSTAPQAFRLT